ncbi:MAG TPA: iron chelate uptake ABC transporter family permease subunit [Syntrophales bacterium]|nr:iron chelate uptake ABC transporter family permease subunit [Syntrophales bacterium]
MKTSIVPPVIMELTEFFRYGFLQRALIAGSFIGILCSTLGVFLVLRRFSLIGDGLAHATFGSVALALLLKMSPLYVSIPIVMVCSVGILRLTERARLYGDAAIGVVSSLGIAVGVMLSSIASGFNIDLFSYLFGSILSISEAEVFISVILSVLVILMIVFYYNELLSITFDEDSAKTSGINTQSINTLFVLLTAVTVVLSMKVVGIMLISALLIFPAVTALQIARSFKAVMLTASLSALVSVVSGIVASFFLDVPTGATIVLINFIFFLASLTYKRIMRV